MKKVAYLALTAVMMVTGAMAMLSRPAVAGSCGGVETALIDCDATDGEGAVLSIAGMIVRVFTIAVGVLAVIGIMVVGVQYLTAKDNEEQVRKAKKRLAHVVIGIAAYVVLAPLLNFLTPGGFLNEFYRKYVNEDSTSSEVVDKTNDTTNKTTTQTNIGDYKNGSEPDEPEEGLPPTGDEGWVDAQEK